MDNPNIKEPSLWAAQCFSAAIKPFSPNGL